jgi:tetratricopeptide (TPR) repeat protein
MRPTLLTLLVLAGCAHSTATGNPPSETLATPAALAEARSTWVSSTVRLARAEVMRGDLERGRMLLGSAIERADAEADAAGKATLQAELALVLAEESFYTRTGMERALRLAAEAQAGAHAAGARDVKARAVHAEGFLRYGDLLWADAKDFHVPRELFSRSRQLFTEVGDSSGVAQETFFIGLTEEQEGHSERAGPLYSEARTLAEKIGDRSTLSYAYRHLGGLAEARGDLDQALDLQRRSLALREEIGFTRLVPFALIAVGDLERKKGLLGDARASYGRALGLAEQMKSGPARVWSHFGLGAVDEAEGKLAPALEHYETARRTAEKLGSKSWVEETGRAVEKLRARIGGAAAVRESGTGR